MKIACVGNPNVGKTALLNYVTGSSFRVGNFPGVTVEKKTAILNIGNQNHEWIDLPGIYSFTSRSIDEEITCDILTKESEDYPDLILNIVDGSNLERSLYLTTYLLQLNIPLIIVLTMLDRNTDENLDIQELSQQLKVPIVKASGRYKHGKEELFKAIEEYKFQEKSIPPSLFPENLTHKVQPLVEELEKYKNVFLKVSSEFLAYQILEENHRILSMLKDYESILSVRDNILNFIKDLFTNDISIVLPQFRYQFIKNLTQYISKQNIASKGLTSKIDRVLLNRYLGFPLFIFIMWYLFKIAIDVGTQLQDVFNDSIGAIFIDYLGVILAPYPSLKMLFADGIGGGLQAISVFIPVVFTVFIMMSVLEDSGYLIRLSILLDRVMRAIGLSGKSLAPLLMGFGCNVGSIMGSRILESPAERKIAIALSPFMSCGARLPVYVFLTMALFVQQQSIVIVSLYCIGILVGVLTAYILKKIIDPHGYHSFLVQDLTSYNKPNMKTIIKTSVINVKSFAKRAGKLMIIFTFIFTLLDNITFQHLSKGLLLKEGDKSFMRSAAEFLNKPLSLMGIQESNWPASIGILNGLLAKETVVASMATGYRTFLNQKNHDEEKSKETYLESVKEGTYQLFVSLKDAFLTIPHNLIGSYENGKWNNGLFLQVNFYIPFYDLLLGGDDVLEGEVGDVLGESVDEYGKIFPVIRKQFEASSIKDPEKRKLNGQLSAYAFLLFILLYTACIQVLDSTKKELGLKWMLGIVAYQLVLAYAVAVIFYQISYYIFIY